MMKTVFAGLSLAGLLGIAAAAQDAAPAPYPEFSFKRVKAPPPGTTRFITVQIQPDAEIVVPDHNDAPPDPEPPRAGGADWFWAVVPPGIGADAPQRMQAALGLIGNADPGTVSAPPLDRLVAISNTHAIDILTSTVGTRVSPALALAVIAVESAGRTGAVSSAGAEGLMQLMPATAERFGVADSMDPGQNIGGGVAYLDWLIEEFDGDAVLALAGYNAGENAVKKHGGVPPYPETRAYVPKVLAAWKVARALCQTPPDLVTDGCVFQLAGGSLPRN